MKNLTTDQEKELEWRKVNRELSNYKKKYNKQRQETMMAVARAHDLNLKRKTLEGNVKWLTKELHRFKVAIKITLEENGHLADGESCTLIELKRALTPNVQADAPPVGGRGRA